MPYDRAYEPVIAGGTLYYGTSSDGKIVAVDAATGSPRWTCFADGPVRFAPAAWRDRIFVASDDGHLYCLSSADGRVQWKLRGGPEADMLLGNDRMISRWPARGAPVVVGDQVYFAAGIWPSEGIFLYAVDAATGRKEWCNDSSGNIDMPQPHGGAQAVSGVAAQGWLAIDGETLLVPTGRAVPAAFDRASGQFRYFHLQANRAEGGSDVVAADGYFVNSGTMFHTADGAVLCTLGKRIGERPQESVPGYPVNVQVAVHPQWFVHSSGSTVSAIDRRGLLVEKDRVDARGKTVQVKALAKPAWSVELPDPPVSLIAAGDQIIAGGKDRVTILDAASGETRWTGQIDGIAYGLAAADGRLYVSTDRGVIACFDGGTAQTTKSGPQKNPVASQPAAPADDPLYAGAADEIISRCGVEQGYCLDLACGDGRLALALARRTKLRIYAIDSDPERVQAARRMLDTAGVYGVQVTVHQGDPAKLPYPDYFADLVVSGRSTVEGPGAVPRESIARVQRPFGGVACLGPPGKLEQSVRGPLEGAAPWTHQYADAANTLCSGDLLPRGPLGMLWFRDTDLLMPSRHGRGPAPLVADGRMFVEGMSALRAVNLYNGTTLWEIPLADILRPYHQDHLTGAAATGSNFCLGKDRLYLHAGSKCLVLDAATGRQLAQWDAPLRPDGKPGTWGYIAYRDGLLFGSLANEEHLVKESWRSYLNKLDMTRMLSESALFWAMDAQSGKVLWTYKAEHSLRHNAIAIGPERVYLVDRPLVADDTPRVLEPQPPRDLPAGRLLSLDARTGRMMWKTDDQVFGTLLALSEKHDVLVMSFQPTRFKLDSELGGRMAAYRAGSGEKLWDIAVAYRSRPILNDTVIYAEPGEPNAKTSTAGPGKWDLLTGRELPFEFTRSYGCGLLAASKRLLVYRSATLGYYDLEGEKKTVNYGGIRPGCWINAIPAGGLVVLADAASWCTCSYLNQATIALQPAPSVGE
ncbi:MAG: PQQ-binding-like beta-propeller repeat protein [Pirellulales bacterium]|nr:PQQ-binding-like beta-propeller repeat protein [Pirellulales bacterium]